MKRTKARHIRRWLQTKKAAIAALDEQGDIKPTNRLTTQAELDWLATKRHIKHDHY